jgi:hypothetical protein
MSREDELRLKREAIFEAKTKRALVKPVAAEEPTRSYRCVGSYLTRACNET